MNGNFILYLYALPAILISLSFHEMAHAYASYRHGDPTAKNLGRLTMNPLKHLDPFGTLMLVISLYSGFGFGWAKPVPINPGYYKNPKRGTIMVSLAGPLSNLLLALVFSFPMVIIAYRSGNITVQDIYNGSLGIYGSDFSVRSVIFNICRFFYTINIGLAVFNIIPIPPLDGSKILTAVLPAKQYYSLMRYEQYIGIAFLALMLLKPGFLSMIIWPFQKAVEGIFMILGKLVFNLLG